MRLQIVSGVFSICLVLPALADNRETIIAECHTQLQLGGEGCTCIADRADAELSEQQQELLIASVTQDNAKRAEVAGQMSPADATEVGVFIQSAPQTCAQ